jgi:hypothetical protein
MGSSAMNSRTRGADRFDDTDDPQLKARASVAAGNAAWESGDLRAARESSRQAAEQYPAQLPYNVPRASRAALWPGDGAAASVGVTV